MPSTVTGYRLILIYGLLVLGAFLLGFTAISIVGRRQWPGLGAVESLLARLCGAGLLAAIAVGTLSGVVTSLIFPLTGPFDPGTEPARVQAARTQAEVGLLIALVLTVAAVIRVESATRRGAGPARSEGEDWEVDEPEVARRRNP
jgi:hypothetical protein